MMLPLVRIILGFLVAALMLASAFVAHSPYGEGAAAILAGM